jgi:uncharacterized protein (TIGR00369 family)
VLTEAEQEQWRDRFRRHWQDGVAFNKACGITVRRWDPDGVELHLPFRDALGAHPGVFHGGVIAALIDTAGCGAVAAGHDYDRGSRITTVALAVQYFTVDPGQGVIAVARCTRRGRQINYAEVTVRSEAGKDLARGLVTVSASGTRELDGRRSAEEVDHRGAGALGQHLPGLGEMGAP